LRSNILFDLETAEDVLAPQIKKIALRGGVRAIPV
jgi:hypothetical protein